VRENRSEASTVTATDEIDQVIAMAKSQQEMATDDIGLAYHVNGTGKSKQDDQKHAHQVKNDETTKMLDKLESFPDFLRVAQQEDENLGNPSSERTKRARDTRALSPTHRRQSRQQNAAILNMSHARSHSAPHTSSRPSRDTCARSPLRPHFGTSNKIMPVYSHVLAEIDSGASMTMTPHASLIREAQQCNMSIKMADGSVLNSNIKRCFLDTACNGNPLPNIKALHMPDLAATLISSPQLMSEGNMDMVNSKRFGLFLQPTCGSCSICAPHADRIMIATTSTESFPRKNADRLKKDRTRPNRPARRCTAAVFYPTWRTTGVHHKKGQPSATTSHEARPGKPSFCILCLRTSHTRWGKTDNSELQSLASSWDYILTPARDATQQRGATTSRRATVGLGTKGVTRTSTGTKCGKVQDSES